MKGARPDEQPDLRAVQKAASCQAGRAAWCSGQLPALERAISMWCGGVGLLRHTSFLQLMASAAVIISYYGPMLAPSCAGNNPNGGAEHPQNHWGRRGRGMCSFLNGKMLRMWARLQGNLQAMAIVPRTTSKPLVPYACMANRDIVVSFKAMQQRSCLRLLGCIASNLVTAVFGVSRRHTTNSGPAAALQLWCSWTAVPVTLLYLDKWCHHWWLVAVTHTMH